MKKLTLSLTAILMGLSLATASNAFAMNHNGKVCHQQKSGGLYNKTKVKSSIKLSATKTSNIAGRSKGKARK